MYRPEKIISGGQTGADIGGLVGAKRVGISTGGTAPLGYRTEKGPQPDALKRFGLVEHSHANYQSRTKQNVLDSNATLIVATNAASDGTILTIEKCKQTNRPYLVVIPNDLAMPHLVRQFIEKHEPQVLNITGNRESKPPGIASATARLIQNVFAPIE